MLFNARMSDSEIKAHCIIDGKSQKLMEMAVEKLGLSARAYTKVLNIARNITDIEEEIHSSHIAGAIHYRDCKSDHLLTT